MPYSITTKDGITIQNIPDDVPADSPQLRERVAKIRGGGNGATDPLEQSVAGYKSRRMQDEFDAQRPLDVRTGAPVVDRFGAGFKITPQAKANYLSARGYQGAQYDPLADEIRFISPQTGRETVFNPQGLDFGDVAEASADAPQAIGAGVGAGLSGGSPLGAAAGGFVGSVVKQGIGAMLPGEETASPLRRGGELLKDTAIAGGGQYVTNALARLYDKVRPHNLVARHVQKSLKSPYAQEGMSLEQTTGIPLSLGQQTGSRSQLAMEGLARRNPVTTDRFNEFYQQQLTQATNKLDDIMRNITPAAQGDVGFGTRVSSAFDTTVDAAVKARRAAASADFAKVQQLSSGAPVFELSAVRSTIDDLIKKYDVPGGGDASAALVAKLKALVGQGGHHAPAGLPNAKPTTVTSPILGADGLPARQTVVMPDNRITANQMERLLEVWGEAARGKGAIFKDLDTAQQRGIAAQLFKALQQDLDDSAAKAGAGSVGEALRTARANYKANSQALNELKESTIGRYLGVEYARAPEQIADAFVRMKPTQAMETMRLLGKHDPELVLSAQRHLIERAIDAAIPAPSQQIAGGVRFSPAKFLSALPKDDTMNVVFGSAGARQDLNAVMKSLQRIADRAGTDGSPTAPLLMAFDLAKGLFTLNPQAIAGLPAMVLAPRAIAKASLTPEGRRALVTVSQTGVPAKVATNALQTLMAISATND